MTQLYTYVEVFSVQVFQLGVKKVDCCRKLSSKQHWMMCGQSLPYWRALCLTELYYLH